MDDMKPIPDARVAQAAPAIFTAIAAVMADIAAEGISKDRKNQQQGYSFRGIDDVYNALAPILSKHKLIMLPRVLSRETAERTTGKGGVLFYVTVAVEFTLVAAADGSSVTIKTYGEAMDSGDKATNKAMSAAYKYAAMQAFCIPTEGDNDADGQTHTIAPRQQVSAKPAATKPVESKPKAQEPDGEADIFDTISAQFSTCQDRARLDKGMAYYRGKVFPGDLPKLAEIYNDHLRRIQEAAALNENPFD